MRALVVEEPVAALASPGRRPVVPIPRGGRRAATPVRADDVVRAVERAGSGAVVLVRPLAADPALAVVAPLARMLGVPRVLLPADPAAAAWVITLAGTAEVGDGALVDRLEVLAGIAACRGTLPALRPAVIARWAARAWRPCGRCGRGGVHGAPCGGCGMPAPGAT